MRYRFGELEIDTAAHVVTRGATVLHAWPKVFDVLCHLIAHRGRTVTKQELLDTFWSDAVVDEVAVPWTVSHARRLIGQRSGDKSPIETVHGRGYRFTAPVEVIATDAAPEPATSVAPPALPAIQEPTPSPFVGRDDAMRQLDARLRDAKQGRGSFCLLKGPAGIGKTRCMDELSTRARGLGFDVWLGRSVEDSWAPVYWPWVQIVRHAVRERATLAPRGEALLERLGVASRDADEGDEAQPSGNNFWWIDGVSQLLLDAARQTPLLLLFDDLHWADAATIDLLAFVVAELRQVPVLVVASQREGRSVSHPRALNRLSRHAEPIALSALTVADVADYVRGVIPAQVLATELSEAIHRATAGTPLFLQQTVRTLMTRHGATLSSLSPAQVEPSNVARDVLGAALQVLEPAVQETVALASVLGERFDVAVLQQLSSLSIDDLLAALELARNEGILIAEEPVAYRFCHGLLRSILYDALPADLRVREHRRAAQVLERSHTPRHGEIAHHYYASLVLGDYERVTAAALQAARAAARMQAFADALLFCEWALASQALETGAQPRARAELLVFSAQIQFNAGQEDDARRTIDALIAIARPHRYFDLLVRAARVVRHSHMMGALEDPVVRGILEEALEHAPAGANELRVSALSQLSWVPPYALDIARSKALSGEALQLAHQLDDERLLLRALHARLYALSGPDDIDAQLATADEMLDRNRAGRAWVSAAALGARYGAQLLRGDITAADHTCAELGRVSRAGQWPAAIWYHERLLAQRSLLNGDFATASTTLIELREHGRRYHVSYAANLVDILQGILLVEQQGARAIAGNADMTFLLDQLPTAMISMRPSLARLFLTVGQESAARNVLLGMAQDGFSGVPKDINYLNALANLALVAIGLDERALAETLYALLSPYPHHNTPNVLFLYEGSVSHFLGCLAAFLGRTDRAVTHFDDALAMNERIGQRPQLARTCEAYASWLLTRHDRASDKQAQALRSRAREIAQSIGMNALASRLT